MSYFDVFCYCLKKKWFFAIPVIVALICFGIAWIVPPVFKTDVRLQIDTSGNENSMGTISSMFKSSSLSKLGGSSLSSVFTSQTVVKPSDLYLEILSGREVALSTIHNFHLDTLYKKTADELLLKKFAKDVSIEEDESGIISCGFEAKDKVMARDIVRYMVDMSNERYLKLQKERLDYSLEYLQKQEKELQDSVRAVSEELLKFYRDNHIIDLESQMEITIKTLSGYETQINNFKMSERMQGKDNADLHDMRMKRQILEQKFKELRGRYNEDYIPSDKTLYLNSDWAADKYLYEQRRQTDLKRFMTLLEFVSTEIMSTESQSLKEQPVIQIIQDAYLPDWKVRPKRATWAVAGFGISFVFTFMFIVLKGIFSLSIPCTEDVRGKVERIKSALR